MTVKCLRPHFYFKLCPKYRFGVAGERTNHSMQCFNWGRGTGLSSAVTLRLAVPCEKKIEKLCKVSELTSGFQIAYRWNFAIWMGSLPAGKRKKLKGGREGKPCSASHFNTTDFKEGGRATKIAKHRQICTCAHTHSSIKCDKTRAWTKQNEVKLWSLSPWD